MYLSTQYQKGALCKAGGNIDNQKNDDDNSYSNNDYTYIHTPTKIP